MVPKLSGIRCPANWLRAGFGSNVSIWLGPPAIIRKMTDLAFAGKCRHFGASGLAGSGAARPSRESRSSSAQEPKPSPTWVIQSRRVNNGRCTPVPLLLLPPKPLILVPKLRLGTHDSKLRVETWLSVAGVTDPGPRVQKDTRTG